MLWKTAHFTLWKIFSQGMEREPKMAFGLDRNFSAHALFLCIVRRNLSHALLTKKLPRGKLFL